MKPISLSTFPAGVHRIIYNRPTWISQCSVYWECYFSFCWCSTSGATYSRACPSAKSISIRFLVMIPPMRAWCSVDTRASWSSSSDPDIATNQSHPLVPIICVDLRLGRSGGLNNNQRHQHRLCWCCGCWCLSFRSMRSYTIMSFPLTWFLWRAVITHMGSPIWSQTISENRIVEFQVVSATVADCHIGSPYGSTPNRYQIHGPGRE